MLRYTWLTTPSPCHPEAVPDSPCRGKDDDDPVEELTDPAPALQAIQWRMLVADGNRDPPSDDPTATGTQKSRRKRALPKSASEDHDSVYLVGGRERWLSFSEGQSSPSH